MKKVEKDTPGDKPDCFHWIQYQETDENDLVWQICKRCSRKLFVRRDKGNE